MKKIILAGLLLSSLLFVGCTNRPIETAENFDTFRLGFVPTENAIELTSKAEALAAFLEQEMNLKVEVFVPTSYEPLIEGLRFNNLDAAFMDSSPAWIAHNKAGAEVVLAELKNGEPFYYAEIFALADSNINSLNDIPGKRIAFTSMTGSSGFIFPIGEMINRGFIRPKNDDFASLEMALQDTFESYTVSGGYSQSLNLLLSGQVDVVGGSHKAPTDFLTPEDATKIKTVVRLGKSPSHPIVVRKGLPLEIQERFVQAMMLLNESENVALLENLYGVSGLIQTDTRSHLQDLGRRVQAVTGIQEDLLNKKR